MIREIINGIITAIRTEYDESFRIYTESVEQGLKEPCFSILCLNSQNEQAVGIRYNRVYPFNITYFPSSEEPKIECLDVADILYDLLEVIDVGTVKLRGTSMIGSVVDGVLQFQVTYMPMVMKEITAEDGMDGIDVNTSGKG